jgi:hypothetical protein
MKTKIKTFLSLCTFIAVGASLSAVPIFHCQKIDTNKSEIFFTVRDSDGKELPDIFDIFSDGKRIAPLFQKKYVVKLQDAPTPSVDMLVYYGGAKVMTASVNDIPCFFSDVFGSAGTRSTFDIPNLLVRYANLKKEKYPEEDLNVWLLLDRCTQADDNAEHLYRYIRDRYPEREIYFALNRNSEHWGRLEKEGFQLVPFDLKDEGNPKNLILFWQKYRKLFHRNQLTLLKYGMVQIL